MIHVESITIKEFRGIRDLTLDFKGKNFAICGPNGTGKSGVVDALEFVLTGNISRLSGEGRGEVSLKEHAPHVDKRDDPAKAVVTAKVTLTALGKTITIERNAKTPANPKISSNEPAVQEALLEVQSHPEIVLSRRELIRYVLATPGKRAEEVQALLRLDRIEQVRTRLQKIANGIEKVLIPLANDAKTSGDNLARALGLPELTAEKVLFAANTQRVALGLPPLSEITATTSLKDGLAVPLPAKPQSVAKDQATADIKAARIAIESLENDATKSLAAALLSELTGLAADAPLMAQLTRQGFYATGLKLIEDGICPFCDTKWDPKDLLAHAQSKIEKLKSIAQRRSDLEKRIIPVASSLRVVRAAIETIIRHAALMKPAVAMTASTEYAASIRKQEDAFAALFPLSDTESALKSLTTIPQSLRDNISELEKAVAAMPDPSKLDAAREVLTIAQEKLEALRDARRKHKAARIQAERARKVSDAFVSTSDAVLSGLYNDVQKKFVELYGFINRADEDKFTAKLVPSVGKLGFEVDFYGRGFFPPGAYHSEGHQDGMGLCLYLALMRHLQGERFSFAVLDDVLMSVDTGHRREVCELLKKQFPDTQFVMTTHDPIWLKHMKTVSLVVGRNAVQFRTWDVDNGPIQWDDRDIWTELDDYLKKNDVRSAAALLRNYLEYIAAELCHRLRAPVQFRADAHYQLGELLPPALACLKKYFISAKESANSWGHKDVVASIVVISDNFAALVAASQVEQWSVNAAIHFNAWDNLSENDFMPVVQAFKNLLVGMMCSACGEFLYVSPERESPESLRCSCMKTNLNLVKKTLGS